MLGLRLPAPHIGLLGILVGVGCVRAVPEPTVRMAGHPDLICPMGSMPTGTPPPMGIEVWCRRLDPDGRTWVRHGPSLSWYRVPDGTAELRSAEGSWESGKRSGLWVEWYENGNPKTRGSYTQGVKEGLWTTFHPDGGRAAEGHYVAGVEQGTWTFWDAASTWRAEGEFVLGHRDGVWLEYGASPEPVRERLYRGGELITVRER